jgi:hypothetical protein
MLGLVEPQGSQGPTRRNALRAGVAQEEADAMPSWSSY